MFIAANHLEWKFWLSAFASFLPDDEVQKRYKKKKQKTTENCAGFFSLSASLGQNNQLMQSCVTIGAPLNHSYFSVFVIVEQNTYHNFNS